MWDYTDKVKEYYLHPKNVGEIDNPDAEAEVGSVICGDALKLTLRFDDEKKRIVDAKFKTFGCGSAIATSSVLTEMIKGKELEEALKITNKEITDFLGGLPEEKMHCSVMAEEALEKALSSYLNRDEEKTPRNNEDPMICQCFSVSKSKLIKAIEENHLNTVEEVTHYTKAGGACGKCHKDIQAVLDEYYEQERQEEEPQKALTHLQKINIIQDFINNEIAEQVRSDGGEIELVDVQLPNVYISLKGACASCSASSFTIKNIERLIGERINEKIIVHSQNKN